MDLTELIGEMNRFVETQGWYAQDSPKPQTARNLALSLAIEVAEVLELFQWQENLPDPQPLAEELADVTLYLLQLANLAGIDLERAVLDKLRLNYGRAWEEPKASGEP